MIRRHVIFTLNSVIYLGIIAFAYAVINRDYVFDPKLGVFGVTIPVIVYLTAVLVVAYFVQRAMSRAHGFGRLVDFVISVVMLALMIWTLADWLGVPGTGRASAWIIEKTGIVAASTPDPYKVVTVIYFGTLAFLDVLFEDALGFGRGGAAKPGLDMDHDMHLGLMRLHMPREWRLVMPGGSEVPFTPSNALLQRFAERVGAGASVSLAPPVRTPSTEPEVGDTPPAGPDAGDAGRAGGV